MAEEVHVEVGVTFNIGKYSSVKVAMSATEALSGSVENHAPDLYNRLEKIVFRKATRLAKKATQKMQGIGEGG